MSNTTPQGPGDPCGLFRLPPLLPSPPRSVVRGVRKGWNPSAEIAELALAVPAGLSLEGLTEVPWGTKWRGFSFAEVIRTDPGFANHVHRFVHKTEAQIRFLYYARGRLTPLEYTAEGPCVSPPCPAHDVVTWGSKWHGCAFLEVLRVDPNYPVWLASKVACRTLAQNRFLAFANE